MLSLLLSGTAAAAFAQESRQDVSLSVTGIFPPYVASRTAVQVDGHNGMGGLASYRYMATPRIALEANYQYAQNANRYIVPAGVQFRVHTRMQEYSVAVVYNLIRGRFNYFAEGGTGGYFFTPIRDTGTQSLALSRNTSIGALYGGGVAYELNPSWDLRVEYRGIVVKVPDFKAPNDIFKTSSIYNLNNPVFGVAYHF
jgi:opacity protein-like surface antigen